MTEKEFKNIIAGLSSDIVIYHNDTGDLKDDNYLVWQQKSVNRLNTDGITKEKAGIFILDFFTTEEYSEKPAEIDKLLEDNDLVITDYEVMYETDTHYTHYAYTVEG